MPAASGWCYCRENHTDTRACPGPLKLEVNGRTYACEFCGTRYHAKAVRCETVICNRCQGKRIR